MPETQASQMQQAPEESLIGKLIGRFLIQQRLADGGMGEVYRAEDTRLKRSVAIKRIAPHLSQDQHFRDRFLKEAERASKFIDPHVVAIYDCFAEQGELFLVMEFVEGEDLRERFHSPVQLPEFLSIARQCLEGLKAAHAHGILHCDIKPENIMVGKDGQVKILDFGLAKHLPSATGRGATKDWHSLQMAALSGTPGYVAPEILREKMPDQRADLFSLGVVFYECLAGQHPFSGSTVIGASARTLTDEPRNLRQITRDVPRQVEEIIFRMLEKDPNQRYACAADVLVDLNRVRTTSGPLPVFDRLQDALVGRQNMILGAALLVLMLGIAIYAGVRVWEARPTIGFAHDRHLAILPFTSAGDDKNLQAFSIGLTETLNAKLSQLSERYPIQVVPSEEVRAQSVTNSDQAGQKLGATIVLAGSTQQAGTVVRVNYSLINTHDHTEIHADSITADAADPFAVEDRVVDSVLNALNLELASADRSNLAHRDTRDAAAYNLYLRGIGYLQDNQKPENIDNAINLFKKALDNDSKYDLAYAGLGVSYWNEFLLTHDSEWLSKATEACQKAVALGPMQPKGYVCLGMIHNQLGKYEQAVGEFRHALDLDPINHEAYRGLGSAYDKQGKVSEADETLKRAISLQPRSWEGYARLGRFYASHGRNDEAIKMYEQAANISPDNFQSYYNLGGIYLLSGRYADAIPVLVRSVALRPTAGAFSNLGTAYFYEHKFAEAARSYRQAAQLDDQQFIVLGNLAEATYWSPGQRSQAKEIYLKAITMAQQQLVINPHNAVTTSSLGMYYAMIEDQKQGTEYTRRALADAPNNLEVLEYAAVAFAQMNEKENLLDVLQKALQAGMDVELVKRNPVFDRFASDPDVRKVIAK